MTTEQNIYNLRRQAAEAFKLGNFVLMNEFDRQVTAAKSNRHDALFRQMKREAAKFTQEVISDATEVISRPATGRVFRISRTK